MSVVTFSRKFSSRVRATAVEVMVLLSSVRVLGRVGDTFVRALRSDE